MKEIIVILFFIPTFCLGQDAGDTSYNKYDSSFLLVLHSDSSIDYVFIKKLDTLPCIMLVCDTAISMSITNDYHSLVQRKDNLSVDYKKDTSYYIDRQTYWIRGYLIRDKRPIHLDQPSLDQLYLDQQYKTLPKTWIVLDLVFRNGQQ